MGQPLHAPEVDARRAEQEKEYGTYVATSDIYVGAALAYREGDPVPVSNVETHGYADQGLVKSVRSTKSSTSKASTDGAK